jgi:sporulation protein YlmC with PRC-barrel domain
MANVERIEDWLGQPVLDADGEKLGKLDEVYYDLDSGDPVFVAVKSGLLGRHSQLVPVSGASVSRDHFRVAYKQELIDQAEENSGDASVGDEDVQRLAATYGLDLSGYRELRSGAYMQQRRADAEAARQRADELAHEAEEKIAQRENAKEQAQGASADADLAEREAERARRAAIEARQDAAKYDAG